jgi:tripartite-type tricarboxylate transporter receptor subunit TctC
MQKKLIYQPAKIAFALAALCTAISAHAWEPTKPVELVVPFSAGGASDQMARSIQGIITKYNLMKQPIIVTNKSGASGAEGLLDMKASPGDPNKIIVASSSIYTTPLATGLPFNWRDLTPVAMVAQDAFVLWTNSEAGYKTPSEYIAAVKKQPDTFKMGGTSSKREDHMITMMIQKQTGATFLYIPYKGGGEAATQLSGKHIDSNVNNPSESISQWRAGQHTALCTFSEKRIEYTAKVTATQAWSDIPTCKEQGLNVSYQMLRIFMMPGGVTPDQTKFYVDLLRKVTGTPEWKTYLEKNALKSEFMTGKDLNAFLVKDEERHKEIMKDAGFLVSK